MNALEHELTYPFGDTLPKPAQRFEVAPGVWWLRMPLDGVFVVIFDCVCY